MLEIIHRARLQGERISILADGQKCSYSGLVQASHQLASVLLSKQKDLGEERVAFMVSPGIDYVSVLWGVWIAGGVAVPLCINHPPPSLKHVLSDTGCKWVVASTQYARVLSPLCAAFGVQLLVLGDLDEVPLQETSIPDVSAERRAMILYTSGTTNLPKGVVMTHRNLNAQITTLVKAWRWSVEDHTLCVLPLHHVHGIINVVNCSLWAGARCEFLPDFDADRVFQVFLQGHVNVFMAVPTIYVKLIAAWEKAPSERRREISAVMRKFRLMVSGSAALPVLVMDKWEEISGHKLLERYGMTELGMAISNPYDGPRKPGKVGVPLEGVSVRLCNDWDVPVPGQAGEIQVQGENVFLEYWGQPDATREAFTLDRWFRTGDVAVVEDGYYRILGRSAVDIIKSGGYKISALEIEEVLRTHPQVSDCAVVGLENEEWGEMVAAALVSSIEKLDFDTLRDWMKEQIPAYQIPRKFVQVAELPRNAMGKVTKNEVKKLF